MIIYQEVQKETIRNGEYNYSCGTDASKEPTGGRCINMLATRISNSRVPMGIYSMGFSDTYGLLHGRIMRQKCIEWTGNC